MNAYRIGQLVDALNTSALLSNGDILWRGDASDRTLGGDLHCQNNFIFVFNSHGHTVACGRSVVSRTITRGKACAMRDGSECGFGSYPRSCEKCGVKGRLEKTASAERHGRSVLATRSARRWNDDRDPSCWER